MAKRSTTTRKISFDDNEAALLLYGDLNRNLSLIETAMNVEIEVRGSELFLKGEVHDLELVETALLDDPPPMTVMAPGPPAPHILPKEPRVIPWP